MTNELLRQARPPDHPPVAPHSTFNWLRLSLGALGFLLLAAPYLLFFLLAQIPAAYAVLVSGAQYGIGYWAHLGGFLGGFLAFLFPRPEAMHRYRLGLPV
jgi:membrane associated rhomboid family serine protease